MRGLGFAALSVCSWVVFTLLLQETLKTWPLGLTGFFSRILTLAALGGWVLATRGGWRRLRPRGVGWWLILMGVLSILIHLLWFGSLERTTATSVAMLYRLDLVFVVLIGAALGLERIGLGQLTLVPIMLVGLALFTEIYKFDWGGHLVGDVMIVGAALGFAVNAFIIRHIMRSMDEGAVALYNHVMSTLGFLAWALLYREFAHLPETIHRPSAWLPIVILGLLAAMALPVYYAALRRMDVWKLRAFMLSTPVLTAAVEWPLWGVRLDWPQYLGGAIILAALGVLIRIESRAPSHVRRETPEPLDGPELLLPEITRTSRLPDPPHDKRKDDIA